MHVQFLDMAHRYTVNDERTQLLLHKVLVSDFMLNKWMKLKLANCDRIVPVDLEGVLLF